MNASAIVPTAPRNPSARTLAWLLSGLMLSAFAARAEAPPSAEFWEYLLEFGNARGEIFDPSDYAVVSNIPAKARDDAEKSPIEHAQQRADRRKPTAVDEGVSQ